MADSLTDGSTATTEPQTETPQVDNPATDTPSSMGQGTETAPTAGKESTDTQPGTVIPFGPRQESATAASQPAEVSSDTGQPVPTAAQVEEFRKLTAKMVADGTDVLGSKITHVYACTDRFIIYLAEVCEGDIGAVRYSLAGDYATAQVMRGNLAAISNDLSRANDLIYMTRGPWFAENPKSPTRLSISWRIFAPVARAIQMAFEGQKAQAKETITRFAEEMEARRDSRNRMRYVLTNLAATLAVILLFVLVCVATSIPWLESMRALDTVGGISILTLLLFGALGAFFSVSLDLQALKVRYAISRWEMFYSGVARILIGLIAASVVALLILAGWLLGGLDAAVKPYNFYLFAFVAGFSEYFIPNALKMAEAGAPVKAPGVTSTTSATNNSGQ